MIWRVVIAMTIVVVLVAMMATTAYTDNPHPSGGTGRPNQSCEDPASSTTPGNSETAPGSAFNPNGISGTHYNETSQYDVACFQNSQSHP